MAIEVVEDKPDPSIVKSVICRNCGVKLQYLPLDIQRTVYREIDGGSDTAHWITCPKCNARVTVKGY